MVVIKYGSDHVR